MAMHNPQPKSMDPEMVRGAIDAYADLQRGGGSAPLRRATPVASVSPRLTDRA
jgi:hypothetical protein